MTDGRATVLVTARPAGSRRRAVAAAITATLLVAAAGGCSNDDTGGALGDATVITLAATSSDPTTTQAPEPAPPATEAPAVTVPIDAPAMLQASLDTLAAGYHFRTSVSVAGVEVLVAEGDRVGDGTRLTIWSNGTSVAYVITPVGSWVFPEGGEWEELDTPPATTDPLLALRTPSAVSGTSVDGVTATLVATVAANTLGVPADGTADVRVVVTGTTLSEIAYDAAVESQTASVRSVFGAVIDATPVAPPI
jgi:hypothetical protein